MVSALIAIPSSERLTWISVISFLIRASTSSRLFRTTKNGEPAITPSRFGAVTLIPDAAATDFTRSNRSSTRISFMGRGFKSDRTLVTTTSPCVATAISSPIASVPSYRITSSVVPSPRSSLTSSTVPAPGPSTESLELIAHVALGKPDHDEQQVGYTLSGMGTDRHDRKVPLEIRDPVEPVCGEVQFGEFPHDLVGLVLDIGL